ncbi:MAG: cytidylate kinase-like family protein [Clostridia bacterium]|nr:cytidylate kinase-like family protein [Clostridia bacterium]
MSEKFVITIARQYGSGGREIGQRVAEILGIKSYDKELITMAAQKSGLNANVAHHADEQVTNSLLYTLAMGSGAFTTANFSTDMPINDKLFITQSDVIKGLVEENDCVVIGRCGDYVLRNYDNRLSIFIYADLDCRVRRISELNQVSEHEARDMIKKTDKRRINYYNFYTGRKWGAFENYHASFNSSVLGVEKTAQMIAAMAKIAMEGNK